jgi:hypothetical protein
MFGVFVYATICGMEVVFVYTVGEVPNGPEWQVQAHDRGHGQDASGPPMMAHVGRRCFNLKSVCCYRIACMLAYKLQEVKKTGERRRCKWCGTFKVWLREV